MALVNSAAVSLYFSSSGTTTDAKQPEEDTTQATTQTGQNAADGADPNAGADGTAYPNAAGADSADTQADDAAAATGGD